MLKIEYNKLSWKYWLITFVLLMRGIINDDNSFGLVIGLAAIQVIHYLIKTKKMTSFDVQFRMVFLLLMLVAQISQFAWLYVFALIELLSQILFAYSFMARCVRLMPWNRQTPMSLPLIKQTFSPYTFKNIVNRTKLSKVDV